MRGKDRRGEERRRDWEERGDAESNNFSWKVVLLEDFTNHFCWGVLKCIVPTSENLILRRVLRTCEKNQ